ncbi:MAG TPA: hypothetical protein VGB45_16555 [Abditibacterium sp.]|jgi:hypothetical protein
MKPFVFRTLAATSVLAGTLLTSPAHAAKQYVVVVAEGLSPQVLDLGKSYLRKADEDPEQLTSFDSLIADGKTASVGANPIASLQGLLETAENSGYKTGLVTTGDISAVAPIFYTLTGDAASALTSAGAKYEFLAGGGRAKLGADAGAKLKAAGGTYLSNAEELDTEITGRVLAAQSDADLDYAIDRDPEAQAGLAELATLALDTLGEGDSPFVLVIHDTLIKRALDTKDSPALVEQFRELNSVLADVTARRDDNADLGVAVLWTGGNVVPRFTTQAEPEQQGALFVLSNLMLSFAGAGKTLTGADAEKIAAFADPVDGQYKGWKAPADVRQQIAAGTLNPETAIRASYEPVLKLEYATQEAAPGAYTLGLNAPNGLEAALKAAVSAPAK